MASSIISFPNINNLINFKGKYIRPNIDENDYAYYILTNTSDKYILSNTNITNKPINIEVFAVGGGGAGGYFNGDGGDGGIVIYKNIEVKSNEILELSIGKGAFYVSDKNYINGFQIKIYDGYINDFFDTRNNYIMNMKPVDVINIGLNKKYEQKISNISNLKVITDNDVISTLITNPIQTEICNDNPTPENCEGIVTNWFNYNKGYTIEINSCLFIPYDCSIEIELTAFKYGILFFYNDDDLNNNLFNNDLTYYKKYTNKYYLEVQNQTKIFKRDNIKANEKYYIKIIHSQDKEITSNESNFIITIKLITPEKTVILNDDTFFKFNNSIENYGIFYSTPTSIYNKKIRKYEIKANGGISGNINLDTTNYGKGGCLTYDINNKKIKICKDDGNGTSGIKLPNSFSISLNQLPYSSYKYGSGGGGAYWRLNGYGGNGGKDAGNGISFTNIPSLSRPTENTGGGGGGNSFLTNITERKLGINKLSGADGILILKVFKKKEQTLIQSFTNISNIIGVKKEKNNNLINNINSKIELIYKSNKINIYNPGSLSDLLDISNIKLIYYNLTIFILLLFFSILFNRLSEYIKIKEKERLKYPIKLIYNNKKEEIFLENKYYNINLFSKNNNYIDIVDNFEFVYDPKISSKIDISYDDENYYSIYSIKIINDLINPDKLVLFIENVNKYFLYYLKLSINCDLYNILIQLIVKEEITKTKAINNIKELVLDISNFNKEFLTPIDKNNDPVTDTKIDDKNSYIEEQNKYKDIYKQNLNKLNNSNNITNFAISNFKGKYDLTNKNNWFNILFFIVISIIIIVFISTYKYFEISLRPFIILILFIIILITIISLWIKSRYDLNIFEKFDCNTTKNNNSNIICLNNKGNIIPSSSNLLPYYYILNSSNLNDYFILEPSSNLIVDILVYGTPIKISSIYNNSNKYYEPNIDIYNNILLPNTSSYMIYNNKILIKSLDNEDTTLISERQRNLNEISTTLNTINIYNCDNKRVDICNNIVNINLSNKYTNYDLNNNIIINNEPVIDNITLFDSFDFSPNNLNPYYKYSGENINNYVLQEPFIIIKVKNDLENINISLEDAIHDFKKEITLFETNVNLFLLNKNTKKIIDFVTRYETDNQKLFKKTFQYNDKIYDKNKQAYDILNREIILNFYIKLLLCIIIIIILLCAILYHYNNKQFINITILGVILSFIVIFIIVYKIYKHQRIDSNKYYFIKPDIFRNE